MADDLGQKVVNILGGACGHGGALTVGVAAGELDAVYRADIVNVYAVAVLNGAFGILLSFGKLAQNIVQIGLQLIVGDLYIRSGNGKCFVVGGQGDIVQRTHTGKVAVFIQRGAVVEVGCLLGQGIGIHRGRGGGRSLRACGFGTGGRLRGSGSAAAGGKVERHARAKGSCQRTGEDFFHGEFLQ